MRVTFVSLSVLMSSFLLSIVTAGPTASPNQDVEQELTGVVKQFVEAQKNYESATIDKLLTADYVEVSPAGEVDERDEVLSFYAPAKKPERGIPDSIELDQIRIRTYSDHASLITRQAFVIKVGEDVRRINMRASFLLRKEKGRWMISSAQYTGIRVKPN